MSAVATPEVATPKKHKKDKSAKKRAREEEQGSERKHKRSKSVAPEDALPSVEPNAELEETVKKEKKDKKDKKEKKHKKSKPEDETNGAASSEDAAAPTTEETVIPGTPPKSSKKKKSKRHEAEVTDSQPPEASDEKTKKKKKSKHAQEDDAAAAASQEPEAMDIDAPGAPATPMAPPPKPTASSSTSKLYSPPDMPPDPVFPFFSQTVSLYEPLLPSGWAAPITAGCESQHLRHLHNRYVPSLRGVLLDYSRVTLNDKVGRDGAAFSDSDVAQLRSKIEFGGGFGWITADVRLFIPSRGAWMEGSINLQTEGHVGVVCFGRFNASIEASRLPTGWNWVANELAEFEETASVITGGGADEHGVVRQIHSTGYWVDEAGDKVKGRVRFRIRNFDVGVSGNSTFLSLQGTMLDTKGEKALVAREAEEARNRRQRKGGQQRQWRKRAPEFSMTKFSTEEDAEAVVEEAPIPVEDTPVRDIVASATANGDDGDE